MKSFCIFLAVLFAATLEVSSETDKIFCYYPSWGIYDENYNVSNINANRCTHFYYAFAGIDGEGNFAYLDEYADIELGSMASLVALKEQNPNARVVISIGGWNEGSEKYSKMASTQANRQKFITSTMAVVEQYGFDGVDIDWEYPGERGGDASDRENFVTLLKEFREAFGSNDYTLSAAVGAGWEISQSAYDIPGLNQYLDYILLMTYDFHGYYDGATGSNSPLYPSDQYDDEYARSTNIDFAVNFWLDAGASQDKLILGVPFYGQAFTLSDPSQNSLGAPVSGCNAVDDCQVPYHQICKWIQAGGWTRVWEDDEKVPYIYKDDQWISYDDEESMTLKVQYAKDKNLGGVMVWSLSLDDFDGSCGKEEILLQTINDNLFGTQRRS